MPLPKGWELVIILIVILVIFGPKNLPKLGNALGKTVSNLRAGMSEGKKKKVEDSETEDSVTEEPAEKPEPAMLEADLDADGATVPGSDDSAEAADAAPASEPDSPKKVKRVVKRKPAE